MEVRFERKKKNMHIVLKLCLIAMALCAVTGFFVWSSGKNKTALAGYSLDTVVVDGKTKYVFNVVEVVAKEDYGILGHYIEGKQNFPLDKLLTVANNQEDLNQYPFNQYEDFFYWEGKARTQGNELQRIEPYSIVGEKGARTIVNNEIFKLYMMGAGIYDSKLSVYENYEKNAVRLKNFNDQYVIKYQAVTPEKLSQMSEKDLNKINYIQFSREPALTNLPHIYNAAMEGSMDWNPNYPYQSDINWKTALVLYERAISKQNKLSIALSSYSMNGNGIKKEQNIYKLFQMLNFFNNPADFQKLFDPNGPNGYIDKSNGSTHFIPDNSANDWSRLQELNALNMANVGIDGTRGKSYIPTDYDYDNILIYDVSTPDLAGYGYFDTWESILFIHKIINFMANDPTPDDRKLKVLEIEPSTAFRFYGNENEQKILASWLNTSAEDMEITCVTPNKLNALTVDLISEYDMVYVGDRTGMLGTAYGTIPYQHIGSLEASAITNPLINGLLPTDKTDSAEFMKEFEERLQQMGNPGLEDPPGDYFLKNPAVALALGGSADNLSRARFSGNDVTVYMKEQLKDYVDSGQPVVLSETVWKASEKRAASLASDPKTEDASIDSNLYAAFAETKFKDGKSVLNVYDESAYQKADTQGGWTVLATKENEKPEIKLFDAGNGDGLSILQKRDSGENEGMETDDKLSDLVKSEFLSFRYSLKLPSNSGYTMKVVIDQNGDGFFDETALTDKKNSNKGRQTSGPAVSEQAENDTATENERQDIAYEIQLGTVSEGSFTSPEAIKSVKEMCQFRVVLQENGSGPSGKGGLRSVWTGYMRPNSIERAVKILQVTPDTKEDTALDGYRSLQDALSEIEQPDYLFDFNTGFQSVTASEFSDTYEKAGSLDDYDIIIIGFDYGVDGSDISGKALDVLNDYILKKRRPVIFTKDSISYVNAETGLYRAPKEYAWVKMTVGEVKALGSGALTENGIYKRREIERSIYENMVIENDRIEEEDARIYLEPPLPLPTDPPSEQKAAYWLRRIESVSDTPKDMERSYRVVSVTEHSDALFPEKRDWGYEMAQGLRKTLGLDRFEITDKKIETEEKRDSGTTLDEKYAPDEIQGFTNGALLEFACTIDSAGQPVTQVQPFSDASGVLLGSAPRTDTIQMLNEGVIGRYPFEIELNDEDKMPVKESHAPYYQLDLERGMKEKTGKKTLKDEKINTAKTDRAEKADKGDKTDKKVKTDDVTVWYVLGGTLNNTPIVGSPPHPMVEKSKYFEITQGDAANNYYLYSKENIYYTGYTLPDKALTFEELIDEEKNEMRLFINTLYAALNSGAAQTSLYEAVLKEDGAVTCVEYSGHPGANNKYVCYYDEDEKELSYLFRIQQRNVLPDEKTPAVIGLKDEEGGLTPLDAASYRIEPDLDLNAVPVKDVLKDGEDDWYRLTISLERDGSTAAGLDGKTMIIASTVKNGNNGLDPANTIREDAIHAEIRLVMRSLFDLD